LDIPGVDVRLFMTKQAIPGSGLAGLASPGVLAEVRREAVGADVVHVHLGRDMVSMPAANAATTLGRPVVVQTHDMVRWDTTWRARLLDARLGRRVLLEAAAQVVLTVEEEADAPRVAGGPVTTVRMPNGVAMPTLRASWDGVTMPEIIYSARLHSRKRPLAFVDMATTLLRQGFDAHFSMFGSDDGELGAVQKAIEARGLAGRVRYEGPLSPNQVLTRLSQAQVYVLPSVNQPFPMSLLEAMSLGLPSVITDKTGLSRHLQASGAADVTNGSPDAMALVVRRLLASPEVWEAQADAARNEIATNFRADAVARQLEELYERVRNVAPQP
jgi:glycosyltransferase involved in cell wall biosynthesis